LSEPRNPALRFVLLPLAASVLLFEGPVEANPQPKPSSLIETYDTLDGMCGEVGQPVSSATACQERDKLKITLKAQGWCKGKAGQASADYRWHECGPKSL
jgi:hypothetical protein